MPAKYLLIADDLRRLCAQMQQCGQRKLPTEYELCEKFCCSRQTIRHAMSLLEREGLLQRRHGSGSYLNVSPHPESRRIAVVTPWAEEYTYPQMILEIGRLLSAASYLPEHHCTGNHISRERGPALHDILHRILSFIRETAVIPPLAAAASVPKQYRQYKSRVSYHIFFLL